MRSSTPVLSFSVALAEEVVALALFSIRRDVGDLTQEDVDASAFRATACAAEYEGLKWIRSYWDRKRGQILCLYEAEDERQLREHSDRSRIPCDDVQEIVVITPDEYLRR
jgi:hypothetical protein